MNFILNYRMKKSLGHSFQKKMEKGNSKIAAVKKATGEKRNEINGHSGYVAKPMIKK